MHMPPNSAKAVDASSNDLELSLLELADINHMNGAVGDGAVTSTAHRVRAWGLNRSTVRAIFAYPERSTKPNRSTAWLDGLRGIAATEVVLHHYHLRFLRTGFNFAWNSVPDQRQWWRLPIIRNYWHSAHAMVNVFFVISGFVLTQRSLSFIRTKQYDKLYSSLSSAIFRRWVRLFAPVVGVTFFGVLLIRVHIKGSDTGFAPIHYEDSFLGQVYNWYLVTEKYCNPFHKYEDQWDIIHPYEHVMWTLPLEYYGSLVCYATMLGVSRVRSTFKRTAIILGIIYLALQRANWWSANFLVGTLLGDYMLSQEIAASSGDSKPLVKMNNRVKEIFWSLIFCWSFYLCGMPDPKPSEYPLPGFDIYLAWTPYEFRGVEDGGRFWWMIAGIGLTVSISQVPLLRRVLETRFCQYLGKISFMMYLVHTYVMELIGKYLLASLTSAFTITGTSAGGTSSAAIGQFIIYIAFWTIVTPVLAIISGMATRYIDDPSIRLTRWLESVFTKDE